MRTITKSVAAVTASLALGATMAITSAGSAEAAGCNTNLSSFSTVQKGTKGTKARTVECLLKSAGERPSRNGKISSHDVGQIKKFQGKHKISKTGKVARQTWTALISRGSKKYLRNGKSGADVVRLQRALTASGHKVSDTGWFGPMTRNAVKSYQRSVGLKATGTANTATWSALQDGKVGKKASVKKKSTKKKASKKKSSKKSSKSSSSKAKRAVSYAYKQIGDPYRYGATGPNSWDCSGLTGGAWKAAGVKIPRTSQAQYRGLKKVSKSNLRPGDLVTFYGGRSHIGIYVGNGNIIHASRPGTPVNKMKMKYMPYAGAVRPA